MPCTNCAGFKIRWTRALTRADYADMIKRVEEHLNFSLDPHRRRYRLDLLRKLDGGFVVHAFPGGHRGATKTFRHDFREGNWIGPLLDPYPWPWLPPGDALSTWAKGSESAPLIPAESGSLTHLRAQPRNVSVWTTEEVACVSHVMVAFGAECCAFPTTENLMMDYGPVKIGGVYS